MDYPVLKGTRDNRFILHEGYFIEGIYIPKGFKTDGLTLKVRLLKLFIDKYSPKYSPFFILHDYLCYLGEYKKADDIGSRVLYKIERSFRTKMMMFAIRAYHFFKYGVL